VNEGVASWTTIEVKGVDPRFAYVMV